jgi:hypothetical protein
MMQLLIQRDMADDKEQPDGSLNNQTVQVLLKHGANMNTQHNIL